MVLHKQHGPRSSYLQTSNIQCPFRYLLHCWALNNLFQRWWMTAKSAHRKTSTRTLSLRYCQLTRCSQVASVLCAGVNAPRATSIQNNCGFNISGGYMFFLRCRSERCWSFASVGGFDVRTVSSKRLHGALSSINNSWLGLLHQFCSYKGKRHVLIQLVLNG